MISLEQLAAALAVKAEPVKTTPQYGAPRARYGRPEAASPQVTSEVKKIIAQSLGGDGGRQG